jgi:hypothetical protein
MIRIDWKCRALCRAIGTDDDLVSLFRRHGVKLPAATVRGWYTRNAIPGWAMPVMIHEAMTTGVLKDLSTFRAPMVSAKVRKANAKRELNAPQPTVDTLDVLLANEEARKVFAAAPLPAASAVSTKWRDHLRHIVRTHPKWKSTRAQLEAALGKPARSFELPYWEVIADQFGIDHAKAKAVFLATHNHIRLVASA